MQKTKLLFITCFLLLASIFNNQSFASHVIGYDLALVNVKNAQGNPTDTYKLRLKFYRDVTGIGIPSSFTFTMRDNSTHATVGSSITVSKINPQTFLTYGPGECPPAQAQLSIEYGIYESAAINMATYNSAAGYYFVCVHNARNTGSINVFGPSDQYAILMTMDIPRISTSSPYRYNSSPVFKKAPLTFFCVGKPATINWNVEDPDGDSLVFSLAQPLDDGITKPFNTIPYAAGYNLNYNIINGAPDITIHPKTGVVNFTPTMTGRYLVAFKCEEYRNGVKIGEVRREFQLETVLCMEAPPVTEDQYDRTKIIIDTVSIDETYILNFTSRDNLTDSLFMSILPDITIGDNLFDPNKFDATWGELGQPLTGSQAQNLIIQSQGLVSGQFIWRTKCDDTRDKPYHFTVVTRDQTCPSPFYDTTQVYIYVTKPANISPYFVSPDTINAHTIKNYFIKEGDLFQLSKDSIIKAIEIDSAQVVFIEVVPDSTNGNVNNQFIFSTQINNLQQYTTAEFVWQSDCNSSRELPYKFKFIAYDNDCLKSDTISFEINVYVLKSAEAFPINGNQQIVDTSLTYNYSTIKQAGVNYNWMGSNVTVLSGQGTEKVTVKFNKLDAELKCVVTDSINFCSDISSIIIGNFTGIGNLVDDDFLIYPNPANDFIIIDNKSKNESYEIEIYNSFGVLFFKSTIEGKNLINLKELASGVYILRINSNSFYKVLKP
jgi:hypothetical protein